MIPPPDKLSAKYDLACTQPSCGGTLTASQNFAVGWVLGQLIPMDSSNPSYARCPRCKRYNMQVIKVPEIKSVPVTTGFSQIPEE
jgi:hypothetical protein